MEPGAAGYEVLPRIQQNLSGRGIALVVQGNSQWPRGRLHLDRIAAAVNAATPASYTIDIPVKHFPRRGNRQHLLCLAGTSVLIVLSST